MDLLTIKCRELAFEFARLNLDEVRVPPSWLNNRQSGMDWL